ncbi:MAG: hypothetical protein GXP25_19435 [Planctomycetes bacterium]|nr:hypothetical protein [Planctomycetota bacterium]
MKCGRWIVLGLLLSLLLAGGAGCGVDKYGWHFGLGSDAQDGVSTEADVGRVKDGVLPPEPEQPKKTKKGEPEAPKTPKEKKPS